MQALFSLLVVGPEEVFHLAHRVGQLFAVWQVNDAEVVGLLPMEAAAVGE